MTDKEIAERLRKLIDGTSNGIVLSEAIQKLADELDPPRPEPGTVVWWRSKTMREWKIAKVCRINLAEKQLLGIRNMNATFISLEDIEWKPARILAPDEVAVKIPPVSEWPEKCDAITWVYREPDGALCHYDPIITREEAERREAEQ